MSNLSIIPFYKNLTEIEISVSWFDVCNLKCDFCFEPKCEIRPINYDYCRNVKFLICEEFEKKLMKFPSAQGLRLAMWGGELFMDSIPDDLFSIYQETIDYVKTFFYGKLCEEVYMFCLNSAYRIICVSKISDGIAGEVYIHPSKAVKQALRVNASVVVIAHNHPGGKVNPSVGDVEVNHNLDRAFSAVEIVLADSIIVTENEHFSFREMGYMNALCDGYYKKLGIPPMGMNNNGF